MVGLLFFEVFLGKRCKSIVLKIKERPNILPLEVVFFSSYRSSSNTTSQRSEYVGKEAGGVFFFFFFLFYRNQVVKTMFILCPYNILAE